MIRKTSFDFHESTKTSDGNDGDKHGDSGDGGLPDDYSDPDSDGSNS
jgi:hypothetical protein